MATIGQIAEAGDIVCGRRVDTARHGKRYDGATCINVHGHSGCCVVLDANGERTGIHYMMPKTFDATDETTYARIVRVG